MAALVAKVRLSIHPGFACRTQSTMTTCSGHLSPTSRSARNLLAETAMTKQKSHAASSPGTACSSPRSLHGHPLQPQPTTRAISPSILAASAFYHLTSPTPRKLLCSASAKGASELAQRLKAAERSHGEAGDGARVPRVQPRRGHVGAQPVGVYQRWGVHLRGRPPRRRVRRAAPAVGRVQQARPRGGRGWARLRAGRQLARSPGPRRRRGLSARDGRARQPVRARRARGSDRADRRHRAHAHRRHLLRDPEGQRVPARASEARPEPAHSRAGVVVPGLHSQHLSGLRARQRARPAPAEERPDPVPSGEHALPHRRHHQPAPFLLQVTGDDMGVVRPRRQPPLPRRRLAEPPQGVQDAADGRAGPGEAARRRAGAAVHGEGGQGAPHPGARRPEGGPGHAAAGVLQGRARQQRQLAVATANWHCVTGTNGTENKERRLPVAAAAL